MILMNRCAAAAAAGAACLSLSTAVLAQYTPPGSGASAASAAPMSAPTPAPSAPSAPVSAAKKALVARVLTLQQPSIEGIARTLAENSVSRLAQAAGAAMQQVPAEKRDAVAKSLDTDIRKYLDETTPMLRDVAIKSAPSTIGPLLEQQFSEDELKQLAQWLDSPVNRKYQQMAGSMQNALLQKLVTDTRAQVEPKLKALEGRMSATLQDPAVSPGAPAASAAKTAPAAKPTKPAASAGK